MVIKIAIEEMMIARIGRGSVGGWEGRDESASRASSWMEIGRGSSNDWGILLTALHWICRLLSVIWRHEEWDSGEDMERDPESYHSDVQYGREVGVPTQAGGG